MLAGRGGAGRRSADTGIEQDDYFSTLGKAFVGLRLMLEAYPTKKWFVVLGDDNYVLVDNYVNVLSAFDPEQPWALSRMVHRNKFGCKVRATAVYATYVCNLLCCKMVHVEASGFPGARLTMHDNAKKLQSGGSDF